MQSDHAICRVGELLDEGWGWGGGRSNHLSVGGLPDVQGLSGGNLVCIGYHIVRI